MKLLYLILFMVLTVFNAYGQEAIVWEFPTKAGVYSSPASDENCIYIGSNDSCLYALSKKEGQLKWKFRTNGQLRSTPLIYNESVIFNSTDGNVFSLRKSDAHLQWTFKTNGEKSYDLWDYYISSPVCSENKIVIGSGDGNVYAIEPDSGKLIWKFKTNGIVHATPLVNNNKVYIGSYDGVFYALNAKTGQPIWQFKTVGNAYFPKGEIQKGAAIYKQSVIFGCRDYNTYALNIETGRRLWNIVEKGSWVIATPLVSQDAIYVGTSDTHRFNILQARTGDLKHSFPLNMRVYAEAVSYKNEIIFGCFNGKLYSLNPANAEIQQIFQTTGSKKNYYTIYGQNDAFKESFSLYGNDVEASEKKILTLGSILSTPFIEQGIAYFGDSNGVIYALRLK
ncbi:MAG: PQQ-binding-like beta-propeller repeat protein [Paludibacter sp.]|nr:PQQ-binding-like beta-propeller repeat protein [Paludibacter sp.]